MKLNKLLTAIVLIGVFFVIQGCSGSTCPAQNTGISNNDVVEDASDSDTGDTNTSESVDISDSYEEEAVVKPVMSDQIPDNSLYLQLQNTDPNDLIVLVKAKGINGLSALAFALRYDPQYLQLKGGTLTDLFDAQHGKGIFKVTVVPTNRISIGGAFYGLRHSVDIKDRVLATIHFVVKKQGDTNLTFIPADLLAINKNKQEISINLLSATIKEE